MYKWKNKNDAILQEKKEINKYINRINKKLQKYTSRKIT